MAVESSWGLNRFFYCTEPSYSSHGRILRDSRADSDTTAAIYATVTIKSCNSEFMEESTIDKALSLWENASF